MLENKPQENQGTFFKKKIKCKLEEELKFNRVAQGMCSFNGRVH